MPLHHVLKLPISVPGAPAPESYFSYCSSPLWFM